MKKVATILLVLLMVLAFTACASKDEPVTPDKTEAAKTDPAVTDEDPGAEDFNPEDYPVAICMDMMNHPVHRIVQLGFLKAADELGYTKAKVIGTEGGDSSEAFAAAEAFAAEGGKGLLLWAGDSGSYETIASVASQGVIVGIPHFSHQQSDGSYPEGLMFNLACDPVLYGKQVAEMMAEKLDGKSGSVALTQNTKNVTENSASDSFIETWETLKGSFALDDIKILPVELEGHQVDSATAVNLAIIQANPDILGAFGTTGNSPITWADAAAKAGYADGELVLVGMDATEGNLDYLQAGKVAALVAQPLYEEAYKTMEYLDIVLRGGSVPEWTDLEAPIVTLDGEGANGIDYHLEIAAEVETFFK